MVDPTRPLPTIAYPARRPGWTLRGAVTIASAVAITAIAAAAVTASMAGGSSTLSPADVSRLLDAGGATSTAGTATLVTGAGDVTATLTPGVVTVHCDGDLATLASWIPNPGWRSDDPVRGPARQVSVRSESDSAADYRVTGTCSDGVATVRLGPDDHRGRGGDDDGHGDDDHGDDDHGDDDHGDDDHGDDDRGDDHHGDDGRGDDGHGGPGPG